MFLRKEYSNFYYNYGTRINEQTAVVAEDLDQRLKGYLSNDKLLTKLAELLDSYEDGEYELSDLDPKEFGIMEEDKLFVKVDMSNKKSPKFFMWIMNDKFLYDGVDFGVGATILWDAVRGLGTDEDQVAAVAGAFTKLAGEKGVDPEIYFDKLDAQLKTKYGEGLKDAIEGDFSGYAEVVGLNVFRRKIEPSFWRGFNIWTILGDAALAVATFGGSAAFTAGLKGAQVAGATARATKIASATATTANTLGRGVKAVSEITRLSKVFGKLDDARKLSALSRAGVKVGGPEFQWISKAGKTGTAKLIGKTDDGTRLLVSYGGKPPVATNYSTLLTQLSPKTATDVLTAANVNLTTKATLAAKKAGEIGSSSGGAQDAGVVAKGAEMMGWYDTMAADPSAFIENAKAQGASDIASLLLELKNGSGLFGNTTNQEECSIALLITGLTPEMAKEVSKEYKKIDTKMNVYQVIEDELGGDMSIFAKAYWTACTGEGADYAAAIEGVYQRILSK